MNNHPDIRFQFSPAGSMIPIHWEISGIPELGNMKIYGSDQKASRSGGFEYFRVCKLCGEYRKTF